MYFDNFPKIYYNGRITRNMLVKARFARDIIRKYRTFYPYVIVNDVSPQEVAESYYGNKSYDWLVWFSNDYFDPYYTWPLTDEQFAKYIVSQYGSIVAAQETTIYYEYNTTVDSADIELIYRKNYKMDPVTWSFLSTDDKGFWAAVDAMTHELKLNDNKRSIVLMDNDLRQTVETELREKLNNGL